MLIQETVTLTRARELHVAPCLECGNADIRLTDCNYSSFNHGGGECTKCKRTSSAAVGISPSMDDLACIWNAQNDYALLLQAQQTIIDNAHARIAQLKAKRGPLHAPLSDDEKSTSLMTADDFREGYESGMLTCDDGSGVWATATQKSDVPCGATKPDWATHVVWYNR